MEKTKAFVKKWGNYKFESSCGETKEFNSFARGFKALFKNLCEKHGFELVSFSKGHFYCSLFIKRNEKYYYISISDVRFCKNFLGEILFREADNEKDYRGKRNQYSSLENLFAKL